MTSPTPDASRPPTPPTPPTPRSTTADLLARVRESIGRGPGSHVVPPAPAIDDALLRLCDVNEDLVARFVERARGVGMSVQVIRLDAGAGEARTVARGRFEAQSQLAQAIGELIVQGRDRAAIVAVSVVDPVDRLACEMAIREAGAAESQARDSGVTRLDALYDADIGITDVEAALAESGTLVVRADARRSRGTFLVPPVHIALLRASNILPDMLDLWPRLSRGPGATSRVLITGPSKTADIEGILITGVHGPGEVRILLIDDR